VHRSIRSYTAAGQFGCGSHFELHLAHLYLSCFRGVYQLFDIKKGRIQRSIQSNVAFDSATHVGEIQGLIKDICRNSRNYPQYMEFKDFSRTARKIQGPFKTVQTVKDFAYYLYLPQHLADLPLELYILITCDSSKRLLSTGHLGPASLGKVAKTIVNI